MGRYKKYTVHTHRLRGPHEGYEYRLMLAGLKPLALVYTDRGVSSEFTIRKAKIAYGYFVAIPGEEYRIDIAEKLFAARDRKENPMNIKTFHIKLGRLLGYSKESIRFFIEN